MLKVNGDHLNQSQALSTGQTALAYADDDGRQSTAAGIDAPSIGYW